jgi:hypothetical protein
MGLHLLGRVGSAHSGEAVSAELNAALAPEALGLRVAEALLEQGAARFLV